MDYSINQDDLLLIGDCELDEKSLVYSHISSANDLYSTGIPQIISEVFKLQIRLDEVRRESEEEKAIDHLDIKVSFSNINIEMPVIMNYEKQEEDICYPNMARIKKKTYKSNLRLDIKIEVDAVMTNGTKKTREDTINSYKLCKIPIVVGSRWCNTYGLTKESLKRLHEDPYDAGGYFIINGVEWSVDCVESILFNMVRIHMNEGYKKEKMRAEFISKPGDHYLNSDQFIIRWLSDGQLSIEIHSGKLKELEIPFYILFRMMGWDSDKQIFDNILFEYESQTSKKIIQFLSSAFEANYEKFPDSRYIYSQKDTLQYIAEKIDESKFSYLDVEKYPENYQKITNYILDHIDTHFLQHMGTDECSRHQKMRFMCVILRKVFLVSMKNMRPTDRDSYNSKRIHASGISLAKSIKTAFNATIIQQIKKKLSKDLKNMSFFSIDLASTLKTGIYGSELEKTIRQSITSGTKTETMIRNQARVNRITSQMLNRKNESSAIATLRQITANSSNSAKQSERASEMRRVHMSTLGFVCLVHSPEGEKVGINKQLAIFAFITGASSSEVIKDILLDDSDIKPLNTIDYKDIADERLCNVYVNGMWIGCCKDALAIAKKYRQKRRESEINPEITIIWDNTQDEVYFWSDAGRILRPLIIVYNNKRDVRYSYITKSNKGGKNNKGEKFEQGIAVNQHHIDKLYAKTITVEEMLREQLIEYISAGEQENMLLAPDFNTLKENRYNELMEYTHCDIPQAKLGISALTCPFAGHNQVQRTVYQAAQSRQACGLYANNWPYRADKDTFLQYCTENPLVKTISNRYLRPNGSNCIVAMMCNTGYNVEDSLIINKGAVDRGLFNGCKFHFYESKLEQNEEFANPDITNTLDIKSADFSKLTKGIIKKGVVLKKNDAVIGKILKITKNADERYQYADRSTTYKDEEPAVVHDVIIDRNDEEEEFVKVVLRKLRPVDIGDKFSVIKSSQVLTNFGWKEIQYITMKDKVATLTKENTLDYVNPAAIPKYHYTGDMYHLDDSDDANTNIFVTKNHKLYIKQQEEQQFTCKPADEVFGKGGTLKSWVSNNVKDYNYYVIGKNKYLVDDWLQFIGLYIAKGYLDNSNIIHIYGYNDRCVKILNKLDISVNKNNINNFEIAERLKETFGHDGLYIQFADYLFGLSVRQSRILLNTIFELAGCLLDTYYILNPIDIQKLVLNAEMTLIQKDIGSRYEYKLIEYLEPKIDISKEKYVPYDNIVFCLEIPDTHQHVYYSRETNTSTPIWTGNSARSGQKGTIGLILDEADMPRTADGIAPSIIMNPHSIPSRMTIGQLIESFTSVLCTALGVQIDATIFKKFDIESMANTLESLGFHRYGYHKLFNGITGEWIDSWIFMSVVFYQRLQKNTADTKYAISSGPTDALTRQPLNGKSSGGGLRIGEMERDVLGSHGGMKFMSEKFFNHSDGFTNYVCRCGKIAVVNIEKNIYKCNYCRDKADIVAYNTSWSSKLFLQELESMNVGIKQKPKPFVYNKRDTKLDDMLLM
jgi:DNA-directed RNA polymerase II subunit RPB2